MAAITDSTYYANQTGLAAAGDTADGSSVVKNYPKAGTLTQLPPIVRDTDGTEAATDTFNLVRLLPGQRLRPDLSTITHDDCATTALTIDIGDSVDPDRYCDGFDLGTAIGANSSWCTPAIPAAVTTPFTITAATQDIVVTIATATTPLAGDVVFNVVVESGGYNRGNTG